MGRLVLWRHLTRFLLCNLSAVHSLYVYPLVVGSNTCKLLKHHVPAPPPYPPLPPRFESREHPAALLAALLHVPAVSHCTIPLVRPPSLPSSARPPVHASEEATCACISHSVSRSQAECGSLCDYTNRRRGRGRGRA